MRRPLLTAALCCALLSACTGSEGIGNQSGTGPKQNQVKPLASGVFPAGDREPAPELSGRTVDGDELDVADLRGKVVVLNFWASWCAPCRAEARNLNAVYAATKAKGVEFVGVAIKDDRSSAQAFQKAKDVVYPSLFDPDGRLLLKFRGQAPQSPPTTLILDRQGRVAARFVAPVTELQLLKPVEVLAAETAVTSGSPVRELPEGLLPESQRQTAPALSGRTVDGASLDVADLRGQVVVLSVWASWCGPCRSQARELEAVHASGASVVGLDVKDAAEAARAADRSFPSIVDETGALASRLRATPSVTLVLDRQGRVAVRFPGAVTRLQLLTTVEVLAAER